jgi:hypothetical protein
MTPSLEQLGIFCERYIHDAIVIAQEGFHTIKMKKLPALIVKIDLSKAYDRERWTYLRLMLLHIGCNIQVINWIIRCVTFVSFFVLINESTSKFFGPS